MKIGVILESFRLGFDESLAAAKRVGADGLQIYADNFIPFAKGKEAVLEAKKKIEDAGLAVSALCGDFGSATFLDPTPERFDREKRALEQALLLGTNIITTHVGVVTEDKTTRQFASILGVCRKLAELAAENGAHFAIETGPEKAVTLKGLLDEIGNDAMAVNFDPANLTMCAGDDAVAAVGTLAPYIVHTHAKDGIKLCDCDLRRLFCHEYFDMPPYDGPEAFREMPLGEGNVDWINYVAALKNIGYDGYFTIERECGDDPGKDIAEAVKFLRRL